MTENTSFISIVLPTYNGSSYLRESIQSCLDQTHKNWELIIVDDCSTDETPEIIASFVARDSRIRAVRHETNQKLPGALNTGFALVRGDFLTWTSDDNLYYPKALETMANFLTHNPAVGLVYTDYSVIDQDGREIQKQIVKNPERLVVGCIVGASFLYRRNVYDAIGNYSQAAFLVEDYDYWLRVFARFEIAPLHENLYAYRKHEGSLASTKKAQILRAGYAVKMKNFPLIFPKLNYRSKAQAYFHLSQDAKNLGLVMESWIHHLRAFSYSVWALIEKN